MHGDRCAKLESHGMADQCALYIANGVAHRVPDGGPNKHSFVTTICASDNTKSHCLADKCTILLTDGWADQCALHADIG